MFFWRRPKIMFNVTLELRGRHPYLSTHDLDYTDTMESVVVLAKDWNDAERQAFRAELRNPYWSCRVVSMSKVPQP